jgi:ribosome-associated toxin RatA of RatAB toxin-antitoxin module
VIALLLLLALPPVEVQSVDDGGSSGSTRAQALAPCGLAKVWAVITDHAHFTEFVPHLRKMEIVARGERTERALQTVDVVVTTVRYALDYRFDEQRWHIDYELVKDLPHDIVAAHGSWQLTAVAGGTRIDYRSAVDAGKPVPGFIKSYLARSAAVDLLDAVRKRACGLS